MIKLLPPIIIFSLIVGAIIYLVFFTKGANNQPAVQVTGFNQSGSSELTSRVFQLEERINQLTNQVSTPSGSSAPSTGTYKVTSNTLDSRVASLETLFTTLANRVTKLEQASSPSPSTKQSPVYIPLGSGGNAGDQNWYSISSYLVNINPNDYPGYTSMQLEVNMNLQQAVGEAHAQLYSNTDGKGVSSSEVYTTAINPTVVTSAGFKLSGSQKNYVLQLKSTQGYEIYLQTARIKVNF